MLLFLSTSKPAMVMHDNEFETMYNNIILFQGYDIKS